MKNIIVVTGASSGMGRQFVLQIDKKVKADEIWVLARRAERLNELCGKTTAEIVPVAVDLTSGKEIKTLYEEKLKAEQPNVLILANCAGFGKFDHYENIALETELNMIDLNCSAAVSMINYSLPFMREGAKIMNVVSCAAFQPVPYINVYAATKAFMLSYSRSLNAELKYRKIHVLAVCPYWTKTEFFDRAIPVNQKTVVINYGVMYNAEDVVKRAIRDLFTKKDVSVFGAVNKFQKLGTKLLPHSLVMKVWLNKQKLDGTKDIRK